MWIKVILHHSVAAAVGGVVEEASVSQTADESRN